MKESEDNFDKTWFFSTEQVILTPVAKGEDWTILQLDRKRLLPDTLDQGAHVAGGVHKGLVVNRQLSNGKKADPVNGRQFTGGLR